MRVISNRALVDFAAKHSTAELPLQSWRKRIEAQRIEHFGELRALFNGVDKVEEFVVFDIGGNKFRLIALVFFDRQLLFVRHVLTHREYDRWSPGR